MVRLLLLSATLPLAVLVGFNPTMVRLLQAQASDSVDPAQQFQSHNGAIAAVSYRKQNTCQGTFQSHNGAIAAN